MRNHVLLIPLLIAAASMLCTQPSAADGQNAGGTTTGTGGQVVVIVPGSSSGGYTSPGYQGGGGAASNIECKFFEATAGGGGAVPGMGAHVTDTSGLEAGTHLWLVCRDVTSGSVTFQNFFAWDPATPPTLAPGAEVLAQMAANGMVLPVPGVRTWPPSGGTGLVNLPVWLHVDNWQTISASASAGGITATVEAVPVRSEWDMDEGTVNCTSAGVAYNPALRPDPSSSSCSFTYTRSSGTRPDLTFHNSAVVVWRMRWYATNGQGGDLGELTSPAAEFTFQVEESQALVASAGS